jgi:hypothetical protein
VVFGLILFNTTIGNPIVTEYLRCLIERCKQFSACLVDHDEIF